MTKVERLDFLLAVLMASILALLFSLQQRIFGHNTSFLLPPSSESLRLNLC